MFQLIRDHQLNIMFGLSSICVVVGFFALITKSLPKRRKLAIAYLEFSSSLLLYSDRLAYIYQGDASAKGYWMVRISNFLVFFMTISVVHAFNLYIDDICVDENARGKHIGKSLYDYVRDYALAIGCNNITLNVWEGNDSAKHFYNKCGLKPQKTTLEKIL